MLAKKTKKKEFIKIIPYCLDFFINKDNKENIYKLTNIDYFDSFDYKTIKIYKQKSGEEKRTEGI